MANPSTDHANFDAGDHLAPVPDDNRPGHHPDHEQDQPDPDAFVERFDRGGTHPASAGHQSTGHDNGATGAPLLSAVSDEVRSVPTAVLDVLRAAVSTTSPVVRDLRSFTARRLRSLADVLEPEPGRRRH